jgi:hypothetical protein
VTERIDALVDPMQAPGLHASVDAAVPETAGAQMRSGDPAVVARGDCRSLCEFGIHMRP